MKNYLLCAVLSIICINTVKAQIWNQLGAGAGGQVRANFLDWDGTSYYYYSGSDVAGVWKTNAIPSSNISSLSAYEYTYISNHEIMRFVNKFYRPDTYTSNYIFVGNISGIHRIDRTVANGDMKKILALNESWVSDLFISATPGPNHTIYFATGNTRTDDDVPANKKAAATMDFYYGTLNSSEDQVTVTGSVNLAGLNTTTGRNVYCMNVNENGAGQGDDAFYAGTENGLYNFL